MIVQKIKKEIINNLHFPKEDVLIENNKRVLRGNALKECLFLGNDFHHKVLIFFEDIEGEKVVETTVWGLTDTQVILKKNVFIPINRIKEVQTI